MKKYIIALLLGSLIGASQLQAQVVLQALEGGSNARATIQNIVIEKLSFHTTQGKITTQNITIPYTNGMGSFSGVNLSVPLTNGENNDTNTATLSISSGQFSNSGNITARLTIDGDGEYLIKKNDNGEVIDFAVFNVNLDGATFKIILRSRGGWRATARHTSVASFTRNDCGSNYTGGSVYYSGTGFGEGFSTVNYANALQEAETQALNAYNYQGQTYANQNAECTYNGGSGGGSGGSGGGYNRYYVKIPTQRYYGRVECSGANFSDRVSDTVWLQTDWIQVNYYVYQNPLYRGNWMDSENQKRIDLLNGLDNLCRQKLMDKCIKAGLLIDNEDEVEPDCRFDINESYRSSYHDDGGWYPTIEKKIE